MEIVTYVRQGVVTHEDSAGKVGHTVAGDVQVMSAGSGISHSEHNRSEDPLTLFQIWLLPRRRGGAPGWDSRKFPKSDRAGRLILLASGNPATARRYRSVPTPGSSARLSSPERASRTLWAGSAMPHVDGPTRPLDSGQHRPSSRGCGGKADRLVRHCTVSGRC
ncbi:MAG TPA: pirin family protein [Reyranella sp.]|nr:pirin family protein [Reyranella sp.]